MSASTEITGASGTHGTLPGVEPEIVFLTDGGQPATAFLDRLIAFIDAAHTSLDICLKHRIWFRRLHRWRAACPDLAIRSTFIVGFPGETEADFQLLLDWIGEAKLARAGCFKYEPVEGAAANALPGAVPSIFAGIKLGVGMGLILIAISEMIGAKNGIGYMIWNAWQILTVETMYVGLLVIAILGFVFAVALDALEQRLVPWQRD